MPNEREKGTNEGDVHQSGCMLSLESKEKSESKNGLVIEDGLSNKVLFGALINVTILLVELDPS